MNTADTLPGESGNAEPSAGSAELSIPKHRFDEVSAEVRRLREEVSLKDRLYLEERQRILASQQQAQNREVELTPEDTGLDPHTHQAVLKTAKAIAGREIAKERALFEQQIGILANRTEKAEFLAAKGSDKAKYLPEIQRQQQDHFNRTGGYMPADIAYEVIRSRENEEKIKQLEARLAQPNRGNGNGASTEPREAPSQGNEPAPYVPGPTPSFTGSYTPPSVPNSQGTRQLPTGAPSTQGNSSSRNFSELSVEEMEARLEEQFRTGSQL